ncbi:hypothetical protein GCK32_004558, partial [Trichostrongylus colubriformis]
QTLHVKVLTNTLSAVLVMIVNTEHRGLTIVSKTTFVLRFPAKISADGLVLDFPRTVK